MHNLAYLIAEYVSDDFGDSPGPFEEYDKLGVHPYSVDILKSTQQEAIQTLMVGTIEEIAQHNEISQSAETGAEEARAD